MKDKPCGAKRKGFGQVLQAHGGGKGGDCLQPLVCLLLLDESGDQWPGGADKQAEKAGNHRGEQGADRAGGHLGYCWPPAQQQNKQRDTQLHYCQRQAHQQQAGSQRPQNHARGKPGDDSHVDMAPGHQGAIGVGPQLHHAMDRNDCGSRHDQRHDSQEHDATAGAHRSGYRRGEGGGEDQDQRPVRSQVVG